MNKFNSNFKKLQEKRDAEIVFRSLLPARAVFDTPSSCVAYLDKLAQKELKILGHILRMSMWTHSIFPRQRTIAKDIEVSCSRKHVNRTIAKFQQDGLLSKDGYYYEARYYFLSPLFYEPEYRMVLSTFFPFLLASLLLSMPFFGAVKWMGSTRPFLEEVTLSYSNSSFKGGIISKNKRHIKKELFNFFDFKEKRAFNGPETHALRCLENGALCMGCTRRFEIEQGIQELLQDDAMNGKEFQTIQEEIKFLMDNALKEGKRVACDEFCRENLSLCAKAKENFYYKALMDLQKSFHDPKHLRRNWQQWAFAQFGKGVICPQHEKVKNARAVSTTTSIDNTGAAI